MEPITNVRDWTEQQLSPRISHQVLSLFVLFVLAAGLGLIVTDHPAGLSSDVFTRKRPVIVFPRLETIGGA